MISSLPIPGTPLSDSDYEKLQRSWIDRELADKAMLRRVCDLDGAALLGRKRVKNCAGIVFPYIVPGETRAREYRVRVDCPELETRADGSVREKNKYLSPPQSRAMLYFTPGTDPKDLADTGLPIIITEGEKKTLALWRLATHDFSGRRRFLPLGIAGVWNWRGTIGTAVAANGERVPQKGPIPDLDRIRWQKRTVYILFDANVRKNPSVQLARRCLASELKNRGAIVLIVDLPGIHEVNGIDDFINSEGPDAALKLIIRLTDVRSRSAPTVREWRRSGLQTRTAKTPCR